jgi:hypothetical protein
MGYRWKRHTSSTPSPTSTELLLSLVPIASRVFPVPVYKVCCATRVTATALIVGSHRNSFSSPLLPKKRQSFPTALL